MAQPNLFLLWLPREKICLPMLFSLYWIIGENEMGSAMENKSGVWVGTHVIQS